MSFGGYMYLGIDVGTSAVKAVILGESGTILGESEARHPISHPQNLWSEQSPQSWKDSVTQACNELQSKHSLIWKKIKAIGLSGQMHGAVCLDSKDNVIRPAILWNDGRSFEESKLLKDKLPEIDQIAGVSPMPGFTAPKIMWLEKNEPTNHRKIASILLPKDYIRLIISGDKSTDCADAAGTLWFDQEKRQWSEKLCSVSRTKIEWLPEIHEGTEFSGSLSKSGAKLLGLKKGIRIAAGGGDASAGACGVGATSIDFSFLSLGTSGQFFSVKSSYLPPKGGMVHSFAHCLPNLWFHMACMLNGARPLSWWAEVSQKPIQMLIDESKKAKKKNVPIFLPYLTGERTPHNDAHVRGTFYGIENATGRAEMTRSILDAVTFSFADAKDALSSSGTNVESTAVIGGGSKSDFLMQLMSNQLGINLVRYEGSELGPAAGAARLSMLAEGIDQNIVMQEPKINKVFSPEDTPLDNDILDLYRNLYQTLRPFIAKKQ